MKEHDKNICQSAKGRKKLPDLYKALLICAIVDIIAYVILYISKFKVLSHFHQLSHFRKLSQLDIFIYSLMAAIGVISFWRGLWGIMDEYLFPENPKLSYWVSVIIGFSLLALTHLFVKEFL